MTCPPHHWIIATPNGDHLLPAECKLCGASAVMQATIETIGQQWATKHGGILGMGELRDTVKRYK